MVVFFFVEKDDLFDEDFSDNCMGQLMGTGREDGRRCVITTDCIESMVARGKTEYHVTHQLLYSMLAEQVSTPHPTLKQGKGKQGPGEKRYFFSEPV